MVGDVQDQRQRGEPRVGAGELVHDAIEHGVSRPLSAGAQRLEALGDDAVHAPAASRRASSSVATGQETIISARARRSATVAGSSSRRWIEIPGQPPAAKRRRNARSCRRLPTECTTRTPGRPRTARAGASCASTPSRPPAEARADRPRARAAIAAALEVEHQLRRRAAAAQQRRPARAGACRGGARYQRSHSTGSGPSVLRWRTSRRPRSRWTSASISRGCARAPRGAGCSGRCRRAVGDDERQGHAD